LSLCVWTAAKGNFMPKDIWPTKRLLSPLSIWIRRIHACGAKHGGPENRRRLDPVVAIQETLAVGFVFDGWSDLQHYRPDDELRYEVGRRSVTGNTDRFTFRFRRPE